MKNYYLLKHCTYNTSLKKEKTLYKYYSILYYYHITLHILIYSIVNNKNITLFMNYIIS